MRQPSTEVIRRYVRDIVPIDNRVADWKRLYIGEVLGCTRVRIQSARTGIETSRYTINLWNKSVSLELMVPRDCDRIA